jgi:hypothetical protein
MCSKPRASSRVRRKARRVHDVRCAARDPVWRSPAPARPAAGATWLRRQHARPLARAGDGMLHVQRERAVRRDDRPAVDAAHALQIGISGTDRGSAFTGVGGARAVCTRAMVGTRGRRAAFVVFLSGVCCAVATALAREAESDAHGPSAAPGAPADAGPPAPPAPPLVAAPPAVDAPPPAPANDCCTAGTGAGCSAPDVLACVCAADGFCCSDQYDALCVAEAQSGCGLDCDDRPPDSNCCTPSSRAGCSEPGVAQCVCHVDPFCCAFRFDESCVNLAAARCAPSCGQELTP